MKKIDLLLLKLAELIANSRYDGVETEGIELKPVPATGGEWREIHKSANAFLNTRGGILILGIKETGDGTEKRYAFTGYREDAEPQLKELRHQFTDRKGGRLDLVGCFSGMEIKEFMNGRVAVVYVDELPADQKYCFYKGEAYRRILTGDHKLTESEITQQEEYKEETWHARELQPVADMQPEDLDIDKLNEYINQLNRPIKTETIKADLAAAMPFLQRKVFVRNSEVTTLGALVCGRHPADHLGFRCQVHGYVDMPGTVALDKQDLMDNILPLMEASFSYMMRNIQVGVSVAAGGSSRPQYPENLLRETVNNALAHRDYSVNKQVILAIKPGTHISIRNPGRFRPSLVLEDADHAIPLHRIIPEAKPRNPKLADVLRVYRKWEGRGIGMSTLVNLCLQNEIDLPYYRFYTEEVCLFLCCGQLLDERMERLFQSFDGYLDEKLQTALTENQKLVLAYLIKSEWANEQNRYTILLTPDNNHSTELHALAQAGLVHKHPTSTPIYPVYVVDRVLTTKSYTRELRTMFGVAFDTLNEQSRQVLCVIYRFNNYSKQRRVSARHAALLLWYEQGGKDGDIIGFDAFNRKIRKVFETLKKTGLIQCEEKKRNYALVPDFLARQQPQLPLQ